MTILPGQHEHIVWV